MIEDLKWAVATGSNEFPKTVAGEDVRKLLLEFANDLNSSSFREDVTLRAMGLTQNPEKLGYDALEGAYEVKPQNFRGKAKLNGGGNFTDFSWARHDKYWEDDVTMITSGFHRGRLLYVMSFPYSYVAHRITYQLRNRFPDGDVKGQWLRSASFSFVHYYTRNPFTDALALEYVDPYITEYEGCMVGKLFKFLNERKDDV